MSGLRMLFWGIESSELKILNGINKGITPWQTEKTIKTARRLGIRNLGFIMVGNPGEKEKEIKNTTKLAKKLKLDYIQICRTIPKPGSELHKIATDEKKYDYWREFISSREEERRIYVPGVSLRQLKIEKLLKWAYYSFYFRPVYIWNTLLKTRSINELIRYSKVALRMLIHYFYTDVEVSRGREIFKKISHLWDIKT